MSVGAQIDKFYRDVENTQYLWYAEDSNGKRVEFDVKGSAVAFPVWSSQSRITKLKKLNPEVMGDVVPKGISLKEFMTEIVPDLQKKKRLINLNLSGKNLTGFDLKLPSVLDNLRSIESAS
jgi:hypothetical protein